MKQKDNPGQVTMDATNSNLSSLHRFLEPEKENDYFCEKLEDSNNESPNYQLEIESQTKRKLTPIKLPSPQIYLKTSTIGIPQNSPVVSKAKQNHLAKKDEFVKTTALENTPPVAVQKEIERKRLSKSPMLEKTPPRTISIAPTPLFILKRQMTQQQKEHQQNQVLPLENKGNFLSNKLSESETPKNPPNCLPKKKKTFKHLSTFSPAPYQPLPEKSLGSSYSLPTSPFKNLDTSYSTINDLGYDRLSRSQFLNENYKVSESESDDEVINSISQRALDCENPPTSFKTSLLKQSQDVIASYSTLPKYTSTCARVVTRQRASSACLIQPVVKAKITGRHSVNHRLKSSHSSPLSASPQKLPVNPIFIQGSSLQHANSVQKLTKQAVVMRSNSEISSARAQSIISHNADKNDRNEFENVDRIACIGKRNSKDFSEDKINDKGYSDEKPVVSDSICENTKEVAHLNHGLNCAKKEDTAYSNLLDKSDKGTEAWNTKLYNDNNDSSDGDTNNDNGGRDGNSYDNDVLINDKLGSPNISLVSAIDEKQSSNSENNNNNYNFHTHERQKSNENLNFVIQPLSKTELTEMIACHQLYLQGLIQSRIRLVKLKRSQTEELTSLGNESKSPRQSQGTQRHVRQPSFNKYQLENTQKEITALDNEIILARHVLLICNRQLKK